MVKLLPLGFQVFLEWLLQRWTYARDSTGSRVQYPKEKDTFGKKRRKNVKNPLTAWNQKVGMDRKSLKNLKLSAELVKFCEVF